MKIYLASSWKNAGFVKEVKEILESECGHVVDAFCDAEEGRFVFHYSEIKDFQNLDAIEFLKTEQVKKVFREDRKWIDWAEALVMLLPCGKSAHLEAGYAKGKGKKLFIFGGFLKGEFEAMYGFADGMFRLNELDDLIKVLRK